MQNSTSRTWREQLGVAVGWLWSPVTGAIAWMRHARMFHPEGALYRAVVEPAVETPWPEVARRLSGPALARMSSAWWRRGKELPDALGMSLRLVADETPTVEPRPGDQDLLLATIRHPLTTLLAPLTTRVHDFLANDYYGVSPFDIEGVGRAWLRAVSAAPSPPGIDRGARLERAVAADGARFRIELQRRRGGTWQALATVRLQESLPLDQQRLRFSPFRDGRGVRPQGFVHALRRGTYRASQAARPSGGPSLSMGQIER